MTAPTAAPRPDADHRSPDDLARLRGALVASLDAQHRQMAELQATAEALVGQADSDSLLERELAERGAAHAQEVISDIRLALERIASGAYGICERCDGPIADARLEALPHTRFCVSCPSARPRLGW